MSIVEKAVERLKARQDQVTDAPSAEPVVSPPAEPTLIERSAENLRMAEETSSPTQLLHVDHATLRRSGLVPTKTDAMNRLADELRRVKRPLLNNIDAGTDTESLIHPERIVVTSAVPGEGKTFTTLNLAMSLAREPDFEVLLVDGDIPKANITRVFGLEDRIGLMDVLADDHHQPTETIVRTDIPNLQVVPAGKRHPLASELFRSQRMDHVLDALSVQNRRRLMIFDSSPLLATAEAQIMASYMGQIIMVVAAGRTDKQELRSALQSLNEPQYVGFILNMSRLPASESHYYRYYCNYYSENQ